MLLAKRRDGGALRVNIEFHNEWNFCKNTTKWAKNPKNVDLNVLTIHLFTFTWNSFHIQTNPKF